MPAHVNHPRLVTLAAALACALLAWSIAAATGGAQKGGDSATVMGKTKSTPKPVCPTPDVKFPPADRACQAMGRVTGFQTNADGKRNPFRVRTDGRIVAWSVDLGRPDKEERAYFAEELEKSGPPSARLSILRPRKGSAFTLAKQSPTVELSSELGKNPIFTLTDPLKVRKGMIVALTAQTWVPNLGLRGAGASDAWRASRKQGECGGERRDSDDENEADLLERSKPHVKVGSERDYDCTYRDVRILYRAYLDPKRDRGGGGGRD